MGFIVTVFQRSGSKEKGGKFLCACYVSISIKIGGERWNTGAKFYLRFPSKVTIHTALFPPTLINAECYLAEFFSIKFYTNRWSTESLIKVSMSVGQLSHTSCLLDNCFYRNFVRSEIYEGRTDLSQCLIVRFVRKNYMYCSLEVAKLVSTVGSSIRFRNSAERNLEKKECNRMKGDLDIQRTVHRDIFL